VSAGTSRWARAARPSGLGGGEHQLRIEGKVRGAAAAKLLD
jgi:hypothetical protein